MITQFKRYLFERQINLSDVSRLSGVSLATLSKIANGRVTPKISTAEAIVEALGDKRLIWSLWPNVFKYERLAKYRR